MWKYIEMACGHAELHLVGLDATWLRGGTTEARIRERLCGACTADVQHETFVQTLCAANPCM